MCKYDFRIENGRNMPFLAALPDSVAPMVKKNWTDMSAMGGDRLINDLTKVGDD